MKPWLDMNEPDEWQLHEVLTSLRSTLAILCAMVDSRDAKSGVDGATTKAEDVATTIRERRLRSRYFNADLFADPAWDMLLDLFASELAGAQVSTTGLVAASGVPATTALRWINRMTDGGLLLRRPDARDGRRIFIELAPRAREAMLAYFDRIGAREGDPNGLAP